MKRLVRDSPLILLLSISILLKLLLFFRTLINSLAPSLSISLLLNYNSSSEWHFLMNSQIARQPFDVILLLERLRTWILYLFLFVRALMTISTPSSPMKLPLRLSSLIVLLKLKQSSRLLIPASPISFFLRLKTSRYFLSLSDWPREWHPLRTFHSHSGIAQ